MSIASRRDTSHTVVWWSPESQALSLNVQAPFGLRRDDLIVKDVQPEILRQGRAAYEAWNTGRAADIERCQPGRPSTSSPQPEPLRRWNFRGVDEVPVTIVSSPVTAPRPGGARFGSLVHALLADVPLGDRWRGGARPVERSSRPHSGRHWRGGCRRTRRRRSGAHTSVLKAAARAAREGKCYRETPGDVPARFRACSSRDTSTLAFRDTSSVTVCGFQDRSRAGRSARALSESGGTLRHSNWTNGRASDTSVPDACLKLRRSLGRSSWPASCSLPLGGSDQW